MSQMLLRKLLYVDPLDVSIPISYDTPHLPWKYIHQQIICPDLCLMPLFLKLTWQETDTGSVCITDTNYCLYTT